MARRTLVGVGIGFALALGAARVEAAERQDVTLSVEAGASRYTGKLHARAQPGGSWGVRLESHTTPWLSIGAAYQGSANRVAGGGDTPAVLLVRDGASAFFHLSTGTKLLAPFLEGGLGVARLGISGGQAAGFQGDAAVDVPLAAGVRLNTGVMSIGLRVTYDVLLGNDVHQAGGGDLIGGSLSLGARF